MGRCPRSCCARAALTRARRSSVHVRWPARPAGGEPRPAPHISMRGGQGRRRLCAARVGNQPAVGDRRSACSGAHRRLPGFRPPCQAVPVPGRRSARRRTVRDHAAQARTPVVEPDLILVPLVAIDGRGTRLGRGKGHYDRALVAPAKKRSTTGGRGLGAAAPRRDHSHRRMGYPARRLCVARGSRDLQATSVTGKPQASISAPAALSNRELSFFYRYLNVNSLLSRWRYSVAIGVHDA